jgi:primary-amine oxidase
VFERPAVVSAWRHTEYVGGFANSRNQVELVLRMVATLGNYDYVVDFVMKQDASINVVVTATGIVEIQASPYSSVDPTDRFGAEPYGTLISPNHVATFHSHFFNFRVDLDVDGLSNRFVRERVRKVRLSGNQAGRKSIWKVEEQLVRGELDAILSPAVHAPEVWNFRHSTSVSPSTKNPTGYKLVPGATAISLLDDDDPPQKRAMFSKHSLWVTPQNDDEIWAAGMFVYQSSGCCSGLHFWTTNNRTLVDTDIVAWYTVGMHHVTRQEDGPVMPLSTSSFDIIPENFFQDNPALVIPPDV